MRQADQGREFLESECKMNMHINEKGQAVPEKTIPITSEAFEKKSGTEIY